jgi:hypothetical protein
MQRQRGVGLLGVLLLLVIAGFILTIAVKLGPHYMEFLTVRAVMHDLNEDPTLAQGGRVNAFETLENRLYINSVSDVSIEQFKYEKTESGFNVSVSYHVQEHLFANVDAVLTFEHDVTVGTR